VDEEEHHTNEIGNPGKVNIIKKACKAGHLIEIGI